MCGSCMRFEVLLHAYRHLRWDGDAIALIALPHYDFALKGRYDKFSYTF